MYQFTETISLLECVWTIVSLVGVGFSTYALKDAMLDREISHQDELSTELDAVVANAGVRNERMNLTLLIGFSLVGVAALLLPNNTGNELARTILSLILLGLNFAVVLNTWHNRQDRKKILAGDVQRTSDNATAFQIKTSDTLERLEQASAENATAAGVVAEELRESQGRADAVTGQPGEAGDAASRSRGWES